MKVCIIGGTGPLGSGLASRLSVANEVVIASRDSTRAQEAARTLGGGGRRITGALTQDAAKECEAAVVAIPFEGIDQLIPPLEPLLAGKLVVSSVVPMGRQGGRFVYSLDRGSAAQLVAQALGRSRVASAFHTVPAQALAGGGALDLDVPVTADSPEVFREAAGLVSSIGGLRPLHAGPLSSSAEVERLTPLLLNMGRLNKMPAPSVRFFSTKESAPAKD